MGRVLLGPLWQDALIVATLAAAWSSIIETRQRTFAVSLLVTLYVWRSLSGILSESLLVIPPHGLQLETRRGHPFLKSFSSRRFIPTWSIQDVVINEALRGWNVRYYLAALTHSSTESFTIEVAFENTLPYFPVLLEVYHGIHEMLLSSTRAMSDPP